GLARCEPRVLRSGPPSTSAKGPGVAARWPPAAVRRAHPTAETSRRGGRGAPPAVCRRRLLPSGDRRWPEWPPRRGGLPARPRTPRIARDAGPDLDGPAPAARVAVDLLPG